MMFTLRYRLPSPFATCFLLLLPISTDPAGVFFLKKGASGADFHVLASPLGLTDVRADSIHTLHARDRVQLKSVKPHSSGFLSLGEKLSLSNGSATESGAATTVQCTVQFEGPVSNPPTLTVGPAPQNPGPFLTIFRDTHPEANGWIHGFQKGVKADSTVSFGAFSGGAGEYVSAHPPHGVHSYDVLILNADYELGPALSALTGTPWTNHARALGSEDDVLEDIRVGNPGSNPLIIGRCSTTVSHEQVTSAEGEM